MAQSKSVIPVDRIEKTILQIRGEKVILDSDLAELYDVETRVLNQAVKRNIDRFPRDFMFQLTIDEFGHLKSQIVTSSWGGRRKPPYAFTEQGVAMLSGLLNSPRAILVNIEIMRTFVKLREMLISSEIFAQKLNALEKKYDHQFQIVFKAIKELMAHSKTPKTRIGFVKPDEPS